MCVCVRAVDHVFVGRGGVPPRIVISCIFRDNKRIIIFNKSLFATGVRMPHMRACPRARAPGAPRERRSAPCQHAAGTFACPFHRPPAEIRSSRWELWRIVTAHARRQRGPRLRRRSASPGRLSSARLGGQSRCQTQLWSFLRLRGLPQQLRIMH